MASCEKSSWPGATGLAEDVRYYGAWMREEAQKRIGHLYPPVEITAEMAKERPDLIPLVGQKLTVIAWLWARTVKSPNPAFSHVNVPLVANFMLRVDNGSEVYVQPFVKADGYCFVVRLGTPPAEAKNGTKAAGKGNGFYCLLSQSPISGAYIKTEAQAGRMGHRLMAVVAEGKRGRVYFAPTNQMETIANSGTASWRPEVPLVGKARDQMPLYGMETFADLFTERQLVALTTFSDLIGEVRERVSRDYNSSGLTGDERSLHMGGVGMKAYAEAVCVYLAFQIDQMTNHLSTLCAWHVNNEQLKNTFARQALAMTWDFAETNPFSTSTGSLNNLQERQIKAFAALSTKVHGHVEQADATVQVVSSGKIISTDPPYYDNISYADLSDYFYVWTRHNLRHVFPTLLTTIAVPKAEELIASQYRHKGIADAEVFFLRGMSKAMSQLSTQAHFAFPITIFYAFKQSKTKGDRTSSTGWETFLEAVFHSCLTLVGTLGLLR